MTDTEHTARRSAVQRDEPAAPRAEASPPSELVVEATAAVDGVDPTDLPPLGTVLDPDALDSLFVDRFDGTPREGGRVEFTYVGHAVTVEADGEVVVEPADEDA